ncbi:MAG: translation initiation factor [Proteobacteria bacterium]|nr:translation initiation factor [Pseudomonadota bacterium]
MKDTKLVYTDDPKNSQRCPRCREFLSECICGPEADPTKWDKVAVLRIEKSGRGGKIVTVIDKLPGNENFLKNLAKSLKSKLGTGGTYKRDGANGIIELQGDKREQIKEIFSKLGYNCKG